MLKKSNLYFRHITYLYLKNPVYVRDIQIHATSSTMFLGLEFEHLKFNSHVSTRKASHAIERC